MSKETSIAFTEIIETSFARCCLREAIFRTFPVAQAQIAAIPALRRQQVALILPEFLLAWTVHHLKNGFAPYVSQFIFRENEMVAGI